MKVPSMLISRYKRLIFLLLLLVGLGISLHLIVDRVFQNTLKNNATANTYVSYKAANVNLFLRQIELTQLCTLQPLPMGDTGIDVRLEKIQLSGISLWDLLTQKKITAEKLILTQPIISCTTGITADTVSTQAPKGQGIIPSLSIAEVYLSKGHLVATNAKKGDTLLQARDISLDLKKLNRSKGDSGKVKFTYKEHNLSLNDLFYRLNDYNVLRLKKVTSKPDLTNLEALSLQTRYSREKLSQVAPVERDHVDFKAATLQLFGLGEPSLEKPGIQLDSVHIQQPVVKLYRDKLLPDDTSYKPLYTERLRSMNLDLAIPKINIDSGYVSYTERVHKKVKPEKIFFANIQAQLYHIDNRSDQAFTIHAQSQLMGEAPFEVNWTFKAPTQNDAFHTEGRLYNFDPATLNPFLRTNLFVTMQGHVDALYFTITGNKQKAEGDIKMKYEDFKVRVLRKDLSRVNKVLTSIVNLFTKKGVKTDADGYRHGIMQAEPDLTKSFFNYQWNTLQDGLLSTVTGSGKKD